MIFENETVMFDVFISYSAQNREWVSMLAEKIAQNEYRGRRLRVWFDDWSIQAGDYIREEIENGIDKSRLMLIVLSKASINSDWVKLERHLYQTDDPLGRKKKLIPLLLEDCTLPTTFRSIKYIDFRDPEFFETAFQKLLHIICQNGLQTMIAIEDELSHLLDGVIESLNNCKCIPNSENDALFSFIEKFNIQSIEDEGILMHIINLMVRTDNYDIQLMASEILAVLFMKSARFNTILQNLTNDNSIGARLVAARAFSKIAEVFPLQVDTSCLLYMATQFDEKLVLSEDEMVIASHVARAVGKLRDTERGEQLIELLSEGGEISQWIAIGAITTNFVTAQPIFYFTTTQHLIPQLLTNKPPVPNLIRLLAKLVQKSNGQLAYDARSMERSFLKSWTELRKVYENQPTISISDSEGHNYGDECFWSNVARVEWGKRLPFTGEFIFVTRDNWKEMKRALTARTVVCFDSSALEYYPNFYGSSGFLFNDLSILCHISTNLIQSGIPLACLDSLPGDTSINRIFRKDLFITNGSLVFVDASGLKVRIKR